ncbi:uncharacterized protein LOC110862434 [Folsomia candida]|uniref:uncharacterized protein LOC110862434 n=1 Tax=Folsomia candida TaxID=158441 RepID=UPI000B906B6C|nr:uncharacterized protein LOC110862434 [Folsomia candida]XP_035701431.1 uncharacterized protein LOC110862434 [Folsomia candida]
MIKNFFIIFFVYFVQHETTSFRLEEAITSINVDILKYGIACKLEWVNHARGKQLPSNVIYISSSTSGFTIDQTQTYEKIAIVRTPLFGKATSGILKNDGIAYFYSDKEGSTIQKNKYAVLTNPNNCFLDWSDFPVDSTSYLFNVSTTFVQLDENHVIGRAKDDQKNQWVTHKISYNRETASLKTSSISLNLRILQSLTPRLTVKLSNVTFSERVALLNVQYGGDDTILNKADVEISTSVSHSSSKSEGSGTDNSVTIGTGGGSGTTTGSNTDKDENVDLDVTRDITVPPLTSVQYCSDMDLPELEILYEADATFSAIGLDGNSIQNILVLEKHPASKNAHVNEDSVTSRISGEVGGILGKVTSTFSVNPVMAYQWGGCPTMKAKIDAERKNRLKFEIVKDALTQEDLVRLISKGYTGFGSEISFTMIEE